MKKTIAILLLAVMAGYSCATPDTPKTEPGADTTHITPPDSAKYRPDSTRM